MSATFLAPAHHARLGGQEALVVVAAAAAGAVSSSIRAMAFWKTGSSPFMARRMRRPGTSRRLISFVPSKMRLTRASRQ